MISHSGQERKHRRFSLRKAKPSSSTEATEIRMQLTSPFCSSNRPWNLVAEETVTKWRERLKVCVCPNGRHGCEVYFTMRITRDEAMAAVIMREGRRAPRDSFTRIRLKLMMPCGAEASVLCTPEVIWTIIIDERGCNMSLIHPLLVCLSGALLCKLYHGAVILRSFEILRIFFQERHACNYVL